MSECLTDESSKLKTKTLAASILSIMGAGMGYNLVGIYQDLTAGIDKKISAIEVRVREVERKSEESKTLIKSIKEDTSLIKGLILKKGLK